MNNPPALPINATDEERIAHYLMDETGHVELPPKLMELYRRISFCDDQLRQMNSTRNVATLLQKKFQISKTTAYQIIAKTQVVFGTNQAVKKEYYRRLLADAIVEDIATARKKGDNKALVGLYDKLARIVGLDREDPPTPPTPPPATIVYMYAPEQLGVPVSTNLEKKVTEFLAQDATDAEIEDERRAESSPE